MVEELTPPSPPPLHEPITVLSEWCTEQKASHSQTRRILALLSLEHMLSLPLPPRTARSAEVADCHWHRFLFRRHLQSILRWTTRRAEGASDGFSGKLNWLIRSVLFPDPNHVGYNGENIGACTTRSGNQGRGTLAKSAALPEAAQGVYAMQIGTTGSSGGLGGSQGAWRESRPATNFPISRAHSPGPRHR
jgi:hypothetical protein